MWRRRFNASLSQKDETFLKLCRWKLFYVFVSHDCVWHIGKLFIRWHASASHHILKIHYVSHPIASKSIFIHESKVKQLWSTTAPLRSWSLAVDKMLQTILNVNNSYIADFIWPMLIRLLIGESSGREVKSHSSLIFVVTTKILLKSQVWLSMAKSKMTWHSLRKSFVAGPKQVEGFTLKLKTEHIWEGKSADSRVEWMSEKIKMFRNGFTCIFVVVFDVCQLNVRRSDHQIFFQFNQCITFYIGVIQCIYYIGRSTNRSVILIECFGWKDRFYTSRARAFKRTWLFFGFQRASN